MAKSGSIAAREAKWGEKMIEVKVRFWTNELAENENEIIPNHGWAYGVVRIANNKTHGIAASKPRMFRSLLDIGTVIEQSLIEHGVVLHPSPTMKKYLSRDGGS